MELETQKKIRIGILIFAAVLLIVALIIKLKSAAPAAEPAPEQQPAATSTPSVGPPVPSAPIPSGSIPKDSSDAMLRRTTGDFIARFGTYSTDSENANLKQLTSRMGPTLLAWATARISQPPVAAATFSGVTTHTISVKITSQSATTAMLDVGTQRIYRGGTAGDHTTYEIAVVKAINQGGDWLVDSVAWKEYKP